ncbi:MAG: 4-hydroxy-tetrahydrodipicolinate reductase, partial [Ruthenibacterium sp.]
MVTVMIQGFCGKMGSVLQAIIAQRTDCRVVAGIDAHPQSNGEVPLFSSLAECTINADVLIDFSNAAVTDATLELCAARGLPCVICTTGLSDATLHHLERVSERIAVFKSANMSLGINVLIALAKKANAMLGTDYEIEIIEKHHHNKLDAPSGTALMIADAIKEAACVPYHYVYDRHAERKKRDPQE